MQEADSSPRVEGPRRRRLGALVVLVWLGVVANLTLRPIDQVSTSAPCLICGQFGGVDFILNVVMFLPVGVGLGLAGAGWRAAVAAGFLVSGVIEALQWQIIPGRDASLGDLLSNTTGAISGGVLVPGAAALWRARDRSAFRMAIPVAALSSVLAITLAFLLAPAPPAGPQVAQWAAPRPGFDSLPGVLRQAALNGHSLRGGDTLPLPVVRHPEALTAVVAVVDAHRGSTRRKAFVVAAANSSEEEAFFLGQWGDALVFRASQSASRLRLRPVMVRLKRAFGTSQTPATVTLEARADRRSITLARGDGPGVSVPRTIGLAWTLLLPWDVPVDGSLGFMNAMCLAVIVLPTAFLSGRASLGSVGRTATARAIGPVALVTLAIGLAPFLSGGAATSVLEWFGAGLGGAFGIVAGRLTSPRADLLPIAEPDRFRA